MTDRELKPNTLRVVLAFALAPLAPGLFAAATSFDSGISSSWYLQGSVILGYPPALIIGVPVYFFVVRKRNLYKLKHFICFGALLGACAFLIFFLPINNFPPDVQYIEATFEEMKNSWLYLLFGVFFGIIATMSFWAIAFLRLK